MRAEFVAGILRSGRLVPDEAFDEIYPDVVRQASPMHWTPVHVCARIVELLRVGPEDRLLDIGSGAGKFCIVAAAMSRARVRGVEREPRLTQVACEAARRFAVDVEFSTGAFDTEDPELVDAVYFYNPFAGALALPDVQDFAADRSARRTANDIALAEAFLNQTRLGTRVVTFCGFGGEVPADYVRLVQETWEGGLLELWEKRSVGRACRP